MPASTDQGAVMAAAIEKRKDNEQHAEPEPEPKPRQPIRRPKQRKRAVEDVVAGAISGAIARFLIGPLDVLKIRFQVQVEPISRKGFGKSKYTSIPQAFKLILHEEGIKGLWRGTVPGILLTVPYTSVQFLTLQQSKLWCERRGLNSPQWKSVSSFFNGAVAGGAATLASYPFDLLRTTLAAQGEPKVYHGLMSAAKGILREKGIRGLYSGLNITLLEILPHSAIQFGTYDFLTHTYEEYRSKALNKETGTMQDLPEASAARFACGLLAGLAAKMATHPLDVAKKRFQVAGLKRPLAYGEQIPASIVRSIPACLGQIYRREGFKGLYKGASLSLLKAAPASAITLTVYEFIAIRLITDAATQ